MPTAAKRGGRTTDYTIGSCICGNAAEAVRRDVQAGHAIAGHGSSGSYKRSFQGTRRYISCDATRYAGCEICI